MQVLSITSPGAGFAGHIPSALPGWYNGPDFELVPSPSNGSWEDRGKRP